MSRQNKIKRFSPSKISSCKIRYYISYIEPFKLSTISYPILVGRITHTLLEQYIATKSTPNIEVFKEKKNIVSFLLKEELLRKALYEHDFITDESAIEELKNDELGIHTMDIIEKYFKNEVQYPQIKYIQTKIEKQVSKNLINTSQKMFIKSKEILEENILKEIKYHFEGQIEDSDIDILSEIPLYYTDSTIKRGLDVIIYGRVDLLIEVAKYKTFYVIDLKTGKVMPPPFQLYTYAWALSNMINTDDLKLYLMYLNPKRNSIKRIFASYGALKTRFYPILRSKIKSLLYIEEMFPRNIKKEDLGWYNSVIELENLLKIQEDTMTASTLKERQKEFVSFLEKNMNVKKHDALNFIDNLYVLSGLFSDSRETYLSKKCVFCEFKPICPLYSLFTENNGL